MLPEAALCLSLAYGPSHLCLTTRLGPACWVNGGLKRDCDCPQISRLARDCAKTSTGLFQLPARPIFWQVSNWAAPNEQSSALQAAFTFYAFTRWKRNAGCPFLLETAWDLVSEACFYGGYKELSQLPTKHPWGSPGRTHARCPSSLSSSKPSISLPGGDPWGSLKRHQRHVRGNP